VLGALSYLTTRGRCFLAAGGAAALCAFVLNERDLLRVAVFLMILPVIATAIVFRTRYRLSCTRGLEPSQVPVGQQVRVALRLENVSLLPTGVMLMEDTLPYTLGGRPRFVLDRIGPRDVRTVHYPVRADIRGRYVIGPLSVRLTDPFGMVEMIRFFCDRDTLTVTPAVHPLPTVTLGGEWIGGGGIRARSVSTHGDDDAAIRDYRNGDDLRKVHWRSTARTGELMVRREEQPRQSRAAVALDTRSAAHRGGGPGSSFEWAVNAAASVAVHLAGAGYSLQLISDTGTDLAAAGGNARTVLLDQLACVSQSQNRSLAPAVHALRRSAGIGIVVAVLGCLDLDEADMLSRSRNGSTVGVAVLLDSTTWAGLPARQRALAQTQYERTARLLTGAGWRVLEARHGMLLPGLWSEAFLRPAGQRTSFMVGPR